RTWGSIWRTAVSASAVVRLAYRPSAAGTSSSGAVTAATWTTSPGTKSARGVSGGGVPSRARAHASAGSRPSAHTSPTAASRHAGAVSVADVTDRPIAGRSGRY